MSDRERARERELLFLLANKGRGPITERKDMVKTSESVYDNLDFNCNCLKQWKDTHTKNKKKTKKETVESNFFIFREDCVVPRNWLKGEPAKHTRFGIVIYFLFLIQSERNVRGQISLLFVYFLLELNKKRRWVFF